MTQRENATQNKKGTQRKKWTHSQKKTQSEEETATECTPREEDTEKESGPCEEEATNEATQSGEGAGKKGKAKKKSRPKAKPGRKTTAPRRRAPHSRPRKKKIDPPVPEGEGGRQLISAVNALVGKRSAGIAKALVDRTVAGSASHARIVVDLSGAGGRAAAPAGSCRAGLDLRDSGVSFTAEDLRGSEENWECDLEPEARPGYVPPKP
jgi:hypothetical protein